MITKMRYPLTLVFLLFLVACSKEHKLQHNLQCTLNGVVNTESGKVVDFTKENAVKNGFVYDLVVFDDGTLVVNEKDLYRLDHNSTHSFSLILDNNRVENMKFKFNKQFDDVEFFLLKRHEKYTYSCVTVNTK